jgi:hypothetical protein
MTLFARRFSCWCRARFTLLSAFFTTRLSLRTRFTLATSPLFRLASGGGFAFFRLLRFTLRLDAGFCFFKLLAGVSDMLLFQFAARVAVEVNADCARLNAVQVAPARSIKTQCSAKLGFAEIHLSANALNEILKNTDFQGASFAFSAKTLREAFGQKRNDFFTAIQLRLIFHEIS